jgi:hypothetical protein
MSPYKVSLHHEVFNALRYDAHLNRVIIATGILSGFIGMKPTAVGFKGYVSSLYFIDVYHVSNVYF